VPSAARAVVIVGAQNNTMTVISRLKRTTTEWACASYRVEWMFAETAGLGTKLVKITETLRAKDGSFSMSIRVGSASIEAFGALKMPSKTEQVSYCGFTSHYPTGACGATCSHPLSPVLWDSMTAVFDFVDDKGNAQTLTATVGFEVVG
jgi:hypothetical protein